MQELRKKLNDKDISLNEYKKRLDRLDNEHKQEIQKIEKELEESNIKDKNKVLRKINELNKLNDKYIEEKQIIEQELNVKKQELKKKEQELQNNTIRTNSLKSKNKSLKERLDNLEKSNDLVTKENDELRNEIIKLKKAKVQRSSIIDDLKKSHEAPSTPPDILQDVRKRDNKVRTFAPSDDDKMKKLAEIAKAKLKLSRLEMPDVSIKPIEEIFSKLKRPEDFERERILENINKYEDINLNDVNNLIDEIKKNITMGDNVLDLGDDKYVYFNHINDFLHDIKDGNINNFNREKKYKEKFEDTENKLANRKKYGKYVNLYVKYFNNLKKILFTKKSSGGGLTISSLSILLSKIYTNNSSKKLVNDIEQLINNLYDNKQITKQAYNNLNKAITYVQRTNVYDIYKNDS